MRKRIVNNKETVIAAILQELENSPEAKYYHRLHLALLVLSGLSPKEVAALYNESSSTINHWTKNVLDKGPHALRDGIHPGRPPRLSSEKLRLLSEILEQSPEVYGYNKPFWDGAALSRYIHDNYGVELKVRQCQRLIHQLKLSLRRPRIFSKGPAFPNKGVLKKQIRSCKSTKPDLC
ncbi:MAG TPA: helix-turn-helix domain-containing protein [Anaerovoracaceae bacterium]|nr:helix-turn-helix domain-containing protein [Anaerovoracaceae bacterium]